MTLKMTTETIHRVDSYDLDAFVRDTYGVELEFAATEESGNDTSHSINIDGEVDEFDQEGIDKFLQGEYVTYHSRAVMNYMAKSGLIPTGNYIVEVCW